MSDDPLAFHLVVLQGEARPGAVTLRPGEELVIGRDPACHLQVDDERLSCRLALLRIEGGAPVVEPLCGRFPLRLDGEPVVAPCGLGPGATLRLRHLTLELRAGEAPAGAAEASPPAAPTESAGRVRADALLDALRAFLAIPEEPASGPLERVVGALVAAFDADRGLVVRLGGDDVEVLTRWRHPERGEDAGAEGLPVSRTLVRRVVAEGRACLLTSDALEEARDGGATLPGVLRSLVAAPVELPRGRGVLYLDSVLGRRRFDEDDRSLLEAFAAAACEVEEQRRVLRKQELRLGHHAELERRRVAASTLVGRSPAMARVHDEVAKASAVDVTVLVTGETGTGKELVARALHGAGPRHQAPFVAINCAAIPRELLEAQLFGREAGAYTGAATAQAGYLELADGGTFFLDEIGELPLDAQAKLLRVLESREVTRLGATEPRKVDVRVVAATHVDLEAAVQDKSFREDLYFRLAVFRIGLPPLRARGDDVLDLARLFLSRISRELGRPREGFEPEAEAMLVDYAWPGNVRELRNVCEQVVIREDGAHIRGPTIARALGQGLGRSDGNEFVGLDGGSLEEAREAFEKVLFRRRLEAFRGNMSEAARSLGVSRNTLYARCEALGIDYKAFR